MFFGNLGNSARGRTGGADRSVHCTTKQGGTRSNACDTVNRGKLLYLVQTSGIGEVSGELAAKHEAHIAALVDAGHQRGPARRQLDGDLVAVHVAAGGEAFREGGSVQRGGLGRREVAVRSDRGTTAFIAAPKDLRGSDARSRIECELENCPRLKFWASGVGALTFAFTELLAEAVTEFIDFTGTRHHQRNFGGELQVPPGTQLLYDAKAELRGAFPDGSPECAEEGGLKKVGNRAGAKERPVLAALEEQIGLVGGGVIHPDVGQA